MTELETLGLAEGVERDYRAYAGEDAISKYRRRTAGRGIDFLLETSYGPLFMEHLRAAKEESGADNVSVLEFGCGAGMALQHVTEQLLFEGVEVDRAVGTDLVPGMIEAARADLAEFGSEQARACLTFVATPNEAIVEGVAGAVGIPEDRLEGTFVLALGVNTFRYAVRRGTAATVVDELSRSLRSGGRVVMIDMNDRFPYGVKPAYRGLGGGGRPVAFGTEDLPTLEEYARPFEDAGFEILTRTNFSWMPHSANGVRFHLMRAAAPVLDRIARGHAMRSLVVARKP